jgi:hypothetical protein
LDRESKTPGLSVQMTPRKAGIGRVRSDQ